jgi:hypothetical protein
MLLWRHHSYNYVEILCNGSINTTVLIINDVKTGIGRGIGEADMTAIYSPLHNLVPIISFSALCLLNSYLGLL